MVSNGTSVVVLWWSSTSRAVGLVDRPAFWSSSSSPVTGTCLNFQCLSITGWCNLEELRVSKRESNREFNRESLCGQMNARKFGTIVDTMHRQTVPGNNFDFKFATRRSVELVVPTKSVINRKSNYSNEHIVYYSGPLKCFLKYQFIRSREVTFANLRTKMEKWKSVCNFS